jgi:hypothetical protein
MRGSFNFQSSSPNPEGLHFLGGKFHVEVGFIARLKSKILPTYAHTLSLGCILFVGHRTNILQVPGRRANDVHQNTKYTQTSNVFLSLPLALEY